MQKIGLECPECGSPMVLKETAKFQYGNGQNRKFYGCSSWPVCKGTHGAHPDGSPLGVPGDSETKQLRTQAHTVFDDYWKSKGMSRNAAYRKLQKIMRMTHIEAHIGKFNKDQCLWLIAFITNISSIEKESCPKNSDQS